jgi:hypothetical protein
MHDSLASKAAPTPLDIASDRLHTAFPPALGPAVRSALARVIASPDFPATERNRRFLSFVVEATLDGRTDEITGPILAKRIFMRADDFKSTKDPIVRIEARSDRGELSFVARLCDGAAGQLSWSEEFFGDPISLLPQAAARIALVREDLAHEPRGRRVGEPAA